MLPLETFKEHFLEWFKQNYILSTPPEHVIVGRTYRFARYINAIARVPDCADDQGVLKLRNLRSDGSDVFGQDGYIKYDMVCTRCRSEKWVTYEPTPEEAIIASIPVPKRRMRTGAANCFRVPCKRIAHPCNYKKIAEGKKKQFIYQKMWKAPWLYWDKSAQRCPADSDAYTPEYREFLEKEISEKREMALRYDNEKREDAARWDEFKSTEGDRNMGPMIWWFLNLGRGIKGTLTRSSNRCASWAKRTRVDTRRRLMGILTLEFLRKRKLDKAPSAKGSTTTEDSAEGNSTINGAATENHANENVTAEGDPKRDNASNASETPNNSENNNEIANNPGDTAEGNAGTNANDNINGSTAGNVDGNPENTAGQDAESPANGTANGSADNANENEIGGTVPSASAPGEGDENAGTIPHTSEQTEAANAAGNATSSHTTSRTLVGNGISTAPRPGGGNVEGGDGNNEDGAPKPPKEEEEEEGETGPEPCFDVFTDLNRFDELNGIVAFMRIPSGELILRGDWNWETLKEDKLLEVVYSKPTEEDMTLWWWIKRHVFWPWRQPIIYIEDQPGFLQIGAFSV